MTVRAGALIALAALCLLAGGGHAGETSVVFAKRGFADMGIKPVGRNRRDLTFEHTARRDASGTPDLLSIETVTVVGGVIFVETARPSEPAHACPGVGIDLAAPSGERLRVAFGDAEVRARLYDWELQPLAEFVASGSDALFTYMGVHARYFEAFADNLAGFNLFVLDTFRSLRRPAAAHRVVATAVPGYTDGADGDSRPAARKLIRWMRRSHLMFTDQGVDFVFRPEAGRLAVDGAPYWMALRGAGARAREGRRFDDSAAILAANPAVFGSGFRLARHAAFFRYLQAECHARWRALQASLDAARAELDLFTIPTRRMPYAVR